jgi:hypothetical protein
MRDEMNDRQRRAVDAMRELINGQLAAKARIWGSIENIPMSSKRLAGGILTITEHPEMTSIAPHVGTFVFAEFKIVRRKVDQLDQCTVKIA